MAPEYAPSHSLVGWLALSQARYEDALTAFTRAVELSNNDPRALAHLACADARAGKREEALRIFRSLQDTASREFVPTEALVLTLVAVERYDEAFAMLRRSFDDRSVSFFLFDLRLEPMYERLRADPRLGRMFNEIGLELSQ